MPHPSPSPTRAPGGRPPEAANRWRALAVVAVVAALSATVWRSSSLRPAHATSHAGPWAWHLPAGFPTPKVPADNPMTEAKVALGRQLFYDDRLSHNGTQSCASCHQPDKAFTDGRGRAIGSTGAVHARSSMSLINVAYMTTLTWANPLMTSLEAQAMVPLFSQTPIELGNTDQYALLARFAAVPAYRELFAEAFPGEATPINLPNLLRAIASFERTLISADSPYDRYFYGGDEAAMSPAAKRGNVLFFSEKTECNHCHSGFNLVDSTQHAGTKVANTPFNNTALYNLDGNGAYPAPNRGVYEVSHDPEDMGRFRAVTLRNVALTAPYFHDGSAKTLDDVLDHYAAGGRHVRSGADAGDGAQSPLKSQFVIGFSLSAEERADLHAFFDALTDASIATHEDWLAPPPL
jgi:cytochrome c peroxidase